MSRFYRSSVRRWLLWAVLAGAALLGGPAFGQQPAPLGRYGNEWIRAGQPYIKLKVGQRGLHRLSRAWLRATGLAVGTLDPRQLQLWRRGQEQAIYVAGEADGRLDSTDYVDFFGVVNDGRLDAELYKDPAEQMTHLSPLYADTAAYFLTVAPTNGRRMPQLTSTATGLTAQRYHMAHLDGIYQTEYLPGQYYDRIDETALPWLDKTEGFVGKPFGLIMGNPPALPPSPIMALALPGVPAPADTIYQRPVLELVVGSNNPVLNQPVVVTILKGTATAPVVVRTVTGFFVRGYQHTTIQVPLKYTDFSATGGLQFRVSTTVSGYMAVATARLVAPVPNALARAVRTVFTDSTRTGASQYLLFNTPPVSAMGYDVTDPNTPVRISGLPVGTGTTAQWGVVVPLPTPGRTREVFVADQAAPKAPLAGRRVQLRLLTPQAKAFMIVTHRKLLEDTATNRRPVREYADYRGSATGGAYDTVVLVHEQVYNLFHYGDPSPNGIRRFALFMTTDGTARGYLLLIGRGVEAQTGSRGTKANFRASFTNSLAPSFGLPASDISYTADYQNNKYHPRVPTGRLAVRFAYQISDYLAKVQGHEAAPAAPWRKELLHLGGGKTTSEQSNLRFFLDEYARRAQDSMFLGGHVTSITRGNTGQNVSQINVSSMVNRGLSLITFFGHSSGATSDIDIGLASDPLANYNNAGRYPMLLMNGCGSGNVFQPTTTFGENWTLTPQRGAIAFMALGADGFPSFLHRYSGNFYKAAFSDPVYYGRGIGDAQQRAIELSSPANGIGIPIELAQITEWILQGDPAIRLYTPPKPDYVIADSTVQLLPMPGERLTARASGVQIGLRVRNYGKFTADSVRVQVRRSYPSGTQTVQQTFAPIAYGDTLLLTVPTLAGASVQGLNTFDIFVDWPDSVAETSELNNTARITYTFPSGSVFPLFPQEFAIVPTNQPGLVGEYDQPLARNRDYFFELDTVLTFSSSVLLRHTETAGRYPIWRPVLPPTPGRDSLVWYWRFRPTVIQAGEDSTWATSSFRHIGTSPGGWSQSHYGQFARDTKIGIRQAAPSGRWSYQPSLLRLLLRTRSGDSLSYATTARTFIAPPNGITFNQSSRMQNLGPWTTSPNLLMMVFDPRSLEPMVIDTLNRGTFGGTMRLADKGSWYGQQGNPGEWGMLSAHERLLHRHPLTGRTSAVEVPLRDRVNATSPWFITGRVDSVAKWIERVPAGYVIALVSANRVPFDEIRAERPLLLNTLRALGSRLVDSLHSGDPFVMVTTKGSGFVNEKTYDHSLAKRWKQTVILDTVRSTFEPRGRVISTVIGPVQQWHQVYHTVKRPPSVVSPIATSRYDLRVVPIGPTGIEGTPILVTAPSDSAFALGALLNAAQFPKARLELATEDTISRQAPQLRQWLVTYDDVPEGIVRGDRVPAWAQTNLNAQIDSSYGYVKLAVPFENISTVAFSDSVTTEFTVLLGNRTSVAGFPPKRTRMARLGAGAIGWAVGKINIRRPALQTGEYILRAVVNPGRLLPEKYDFNNTYEVPFRVNNPNLAPLVDVAFDGQHILHGEIVAPAPVITISVRDEDKNNALDPEKVRLKLTPLNPPGPERNLTGISPGIRVEAATTSKPMMVTYEPGRLANGTYRLDVQATDPADNRTGTTDYTSEFRVINETMISNFYPYPNPFSSSTRFLFTVTGRVPQNLKIQIMTVTGRVVREITKEELGTDLRVGNNTTASTWNGTDEYGDVLANGVYLYRVVVQDDADEFKSFKTAGDNKAFHKTWGKLYILR